MVRWRVARCAADPSACSDGSALRRTCPRFLAPPSQRTAGPARRALPERADRVSRWGLLRPGVMCLAGALGSGSAGTNASIFFSDQLRLDLSGVWLPEQVFEPSVIPLLEAAGYRYVLCPTDPIDAAGCDTSGLSAPANLWSKGESPFWGLACERGDARSSSRAWGAWSNRLRRGARCWSGLATSGALERPSSVSEGGADRAVHRRPRRRPFAAVCAAQNPHRVRARAAGVSGL